MPREMTSHRGIWLMKYLILEYIKKIEEFENRELGLEVGCDLTLKRICERRGGG